MRVSRELFHGRDASGAGGVGGGGLGGVTAGHLEGLPLDLSRGGDRLGLDEEGARVDQLHALQRLTPRRVQVLSLAHLGLSVAGQMQDGLRDGGDAGGRHLRRQDHGQNPPRVRRASGGKKCK